MFSLLWYPIITFWRMSLCLKLIIPVNFFVNFIHTQTAELFDTWHITHKWHFYHFNFGYFWLMTSYYVFVIKLHNYNQRNIASKTQKQNGRAVIQCVKDGVLDSQGVNKVYCYCLNVSIPFILKFENLSEPTWEMIISDNQSYFNNNCRVFKDTSMKRTGLSLVICLDIRV